MTGNCKNFSTRFTFTLESLKRGAKHGVAKEYREPYRHPLTLAHKFQELLEAGAVNNRAEIARMYKLSRARVTQIMDLLYLAPEIQEEILLLEGKGRGDFDVTERAMRQITQSQSWSKQCELWRRLRDGRFQLPKRSAVLSP